MKCGRGLSRDFSWLSSLVVEANSFLTAHGREIPVDPLRRRNTSIALEELRRGLVPFSGRNEDEPSNDAQFDAVLDVSDLDLSRV